MINYRKDFGPADVVGQDARVYYNLHTKLWSVQIDGIVRCHTDAVLLDGVTCKVSQAGRARVLRTGRKNVHAFILGLISAIGRDDVLERLDRGPHWEQITYNPRRYSTFVYCADEVPFTSASQAYMDPYRRVFTAV